MATKVADPTWRCEVGDLLVVSRYNDGSTIERSALLLQVKKPPVKFATRPPAARQVELYEHWPTVNVCGSARAVHGAPHRGAQFSFWDVCGSVALGCAGCRWDERIPGNPFLGRLADEVAATVTASGGRRFVDYADVRRSGDAWSGLIWDLIQQSIDKAWSVAARAQTGNSRTWDDGVFLANRSAGVPRLLVDTALAERASDLWEAPGTEVPGDAPPLIPEAGDDATVSGDDGISIAFVDVSEPMANEG
jgi:hypothetical protein